MRRVFFASLFSLAANNAVAMTGAEFLQSDQTFAAGYALGVTEYRIGVLTEGDKSFIKIRNCVISSNMNANTLYSAVVSRLNRHPEELALPAFGAVMNVLSEMCVTN